MKITELKIDRDSGGEFIIEIRTSEGTTLEAQDLIRDMTPALIKLFECF